MARPSIPLSHLSPLFQAAIQPGKSGPFLALARITSPPLTGNKEEDSKHYNEVYSPLEDLVASLESAILYPNTWRNKSAVFRVLLPTELLPGISEWVLYCDGTNRLFEAKQLCSQAAAFLDHATLLGLKGEAVQRSGNWPPWKYWWLFVFTTLYASEHLRSEKTTCGRGELHWFEGDVFTASIAAIALSGTMGGRTASGSATAEERKSHYVFAKQTKGNGQNQGREKYYVQFEDEDAQLRASRGLQMTEHLLKQPGKAATVQEIESALTEYRPLRTISRSEAFASADKNGALSGFTPDKGTLPETAGPKEIAQVEEALQGLRKLSADADLQGDSKRVKEIDGKVKLAQEWLEQQKRLRRENVMKRGTDSPQEDARNRLKGNYAASLKVLRDSQMHRLADHLDQQIVYESYTYKYVPTAGIVWDFEEPVR
jgi:hypothetical protein